MKKQYLLWLLPLLFSGVQFIDWLHLPPNHGDTLVYLHVSASDTGTAITHALSPILFALLVGLYWRPTSLAKSVALVITMITLTELLTVVWYSCTDFALTVSQVSRIK